MGWFGTLLLSLVYAAALLASGLLVGSWLTGLARMVFERWRIDPEVRHLLLQTVRPLVVLVAIIAALESLGVELDAVVALLAVAGLAVALAVREALSNGAAGAVLLSHRPYRVGDTVEIAGEMGEVVEFRLFVTTLRSADGTLVTVPNRLVTNAAIRNRSHAERGNSP